ncbi:MAG: 23S rRNA (pseudouridine(1915)-N(3))-methyltransferase RlmH [Proteobacteria bacterium]|nr:23S rRNA (pseudouridine(1915)-N(3))-methyltransferase RlmH [Pseudomonadota bacterium]
MLKITIISCGNKMPSWVDAAVVEFKKRLQEYANVQLIDIPLLKRNKSTSLDKIREKEAELVTVAIPNHSRLIALTIDGKSFSSENLAHRLEQLQQISSHFCFLIGGPEGIHPELIAKADECWSLSKLTLPHPIVRIVFLEAVYRAFTILHNHPYHK